MEAAGGKKSVYEGGRDQKAAANSSSRVDHDQAAANQVEDDQSDDQEEDHQPIFGCSSESSISFAMTLNDEKNKKKAISSGSSTGIGIGRSRGCQAERCGADLSEAKRYHRRHKVCDFHSKAPAVLVAGLPQRFCQQCSRSFSLPLLTSFFYITSTHNASLSMSTGSMRCQSLMKQKEAVAGVWPDTTRGVAKPQLNVMETAQHTAILQPQKKGKCR